MEVRRQEDALFGSTGAGQSRVSMRLARKSDPPVIRKGDLLTFSEPGGRVGHREGARYLGYGVMEAFASRNRGKAGELTRACLRAPFDFTVHMRLREHRMSEDDSRRLSASLEDALLYLGILGGMGAKSRKGYGSLAIQSLLVNGEQRWHPPQAIHDLRDALAPLRRDRHATGQPPYTALSAKTRHLLLSSNKTQALELLDLVGREFMRYRSWGHKGKGAWPRFGKRI